MVIVCAFPDGGYSMVIFIGRPISTRYNEPPPRLDASAKNFGGTIAAKMHIRLKIKLLLVTFVPFSGKSFFGEALAA